MADCIGTGFLQFPCALVQMWYNIGENGRGHTFMGGNSGGKEEVIGDTEGKAEERGKKARDMYKANCHTGGNTNNNIYKQSTILIA